MDDIGVPRNTAHTAVLRSPHAHAEIVSVDTSACLARTDVYAVVTGADMVEWTNSLKTPVDTPMEYFGVAVDRVRFVGEPVAIVCASDRYAAEDALDDIQVDYKPLEAAIDPVKSLDPGATLLHPKMGSNAYSTHHFKHGSPDDAFAKAEDTIECVLEYPRNSIPPMECFVCVAEYLPETGGFDVLSNFPGPFGMQPVMAWALRVPGNKLRLRSPPNAGGNFGVKLTMFPHIVVMCVASRLARRPVKWVEDRLEHLAAANSAPNRVTRLKAAHTSEGEVTAIAFEHWDDHGAYLRAPMPGPIFRMHGTTSNGYRVKHLDVKMNIVATNKCPTGAVRGFGGPQLYFATERLMHKLARKLGKDPLDIIRLNLLPADCFPYRAPAGSLYDSGNYQRCLNEGVERGNLAALKARRDEVRAKGGYYGIGYATSVEPSQSNMGYIAILKSADARARAGPKDGGISNVTISVDSSGSVNVVADSVPQGQGHATVLAQIVSDQLGLNPDDITVNLELDTEKDSWSIASGNYSSRFAPGVASAAHEAAVHVRRKLAEIASARLNVSADMVEFAEGRIFARDNPDNFIKFYRTAALAHWSPGSLPEGTDPGIREHSSWSAPQLTTSNELGEVNSELAYGFIFDYCGVEIDPVTFDIKIDRYVTAHDCGTILNPAIVDGQIGGSFAAGLGAATLEELVYGEDGAFYSGTFADYLVPTAPEMPQLDIVHCTPSPSPFTLLGAKGIGEGNTYSTPVCIANAIADALDMDDVVLPMSPSKVADVLLGDEPPPPEGHDATASPAGGRSLTGTGHTLVQAQQQEVWNLLIDPETLAKVIPGCRNLDVVGDNAYRADVDMGVGPVRGRFRANVRLSDLREPRSARLTGDIAGSLGSGEGVGFVTLEPHGDATKVHWQYDVNVSGKVASVGGRMLDGAARVLIGQFFNALVSQSRGRRADGFWIWLKRLLGLGK